MSAEIVNITKQKNGPHLPPPPPPDCPLDKIKILQWIFWGNSAAGNGLTQVTRRQGSFTLEELGAIKVCLERLRPDRDGLQKIEYAADKRSEAQHELEWALNCADMQRTPDEIQQILEGDTSLIAELPERTGGAPLNSGLNASRKWIEYKKERDKVIHLAGKHEAGAIDALIKMFQAVKLQPIHYVALFWAFASDGNRISDSDKQAVTMAMHDQVFSMNEINALRGETNEGEQQR